MPADAAYASTKLAPGAPTEVRCVSHPSALSATSVSSGLDFLLLSAPLRLSGEKKTFSVSLCLCGEQDSTRTKCGAAARCQHSAISCQPWMTDSRRFFHHRRRGLPADAAYASTKLAAGAPSEVRCVSHPSALSATSVSSGLDFLLLSAPLRLSGEKKTFSVSLCLCGEQDSTRSSLPPTKDTARSTTARPSSGTAASCAHSRPPCAVPRPPS